MAIAYIGARCISRGQGVGGIVSVAAYNSRTQLFAEREGVATGDYSRRGGLLFEGIFAPPGAPTWATDRQQLWNHVEAAEKRVDARLARELIVALPCELTPDQMIWQLKDFVREQFARRGMVADVTLHAPEDQGDQRNYHAHILLTTRPLEGSEFALKKNRDWNKAEMLADWKKAWEQITNRNLERFGHEARIDSRSYKEQGIDREAGVHLGKRASRLERRGIKTQRGHQNRAIQAKNKARDGAKITSYQAARDKLFKPGKSKAQPISHADVPHRSTVGLVRPIKALFPVLGQDGKTRHERLIHRMFDLDGHTADWLKDYYDAPLHYAPHHPTTEISYAQLQHRDGPEHER